jgi:hypothetical protein
MQSPAPGCVVLSDIELSVAGHQFESRPLELRQLAEALQVQGWFHANWSSSIGELDPRTVTALFNLPFADGEFPSVLLGNSIVAHIARQSRFRPEVRGLFRVYWRTLAMYAKHTGRQFGSWCLMTVTTILLCAGGLGRLLGVCRGGASQTW